MRRLDDLALQMRASSRPTTAPKQQKAEMVTRVEYELLELKVERLASENSRLKENLVAATKWAKDQIRLMTELKAELAAARIQVMEAAPDYLSLIDDSKELEAIGERLLEQLSCSGSPDDKRD